MQDCTRLDREVLAAIATTEGHRLAICNGSDVDAPAVRAGYPARPALFYEPRFALLRGIKLAGDFE